MENNEWRTIIMLPEIKALIEHYQLTPLPAEKTLFTSTYRSQKQLKNGKPCGTAIIGLYCDEPNSISLFHKLPADEVWHFYGGDPFRLILLYADGSTQDVYMGSNPLAGQRVQFVVPAGVWQAGHMVSGGKYSLYGCTMAPGFTDDMFTGGTRNMLSELFSDRMADIERYCCNENETTMPSGFAR
jgi:uncharacterized protein